MRRSAGGLATGYFGDTAAALLEKSKESLLFVGS
jgi:hypothetical protein